MKKIIIITGFILFVLVMGYVLYFLFFKPAVAPLTPEQIAEQEGRLPGVGPAVPGEGVEPGEVVLPPGEVAPEEEEAPPVAPVAPAPAADEVAKGGLTKTTSLTDNKIYNAELAPDGSMRYYDKDESKFYRVSPDGKISQISSRLFYSVDDVNWSPDKNKAILEYPDGSKIMYDFNKSKQYTIPKNWHDFSFRPDSGQIIFMNEDVQPTNRWLAVANPNGTETKVIEPVGNNADKVVVAWSPNNQIVAFSKTGEPMGTWLQEIYPVGLHGENFRSLVVNGRGFEPKWSPTGEKLLYSVYNQESDYKPVLWITDCYGDDIGLNNKSFKINTWANKCSFSSGGTELYCAVPISLEKGSGLYPEMNLYTPDNFYKINLKTGAKALIARTEASYNAENLVVSPDGNYLYFTDKISGQLQQIRLK